MKAVSPPPRALLSVWDKTGIVAFAQGLASLGFEMAGISVGVYLTDADNSTIGYQAGAAADFTETDIVLGYGMNVMGTDVRFSYTDYAYNFGGGDDERGQTEFSVGITASGLCLLKILLSSSE